MNSGRPCQRATFSLRCAASPEQPRRRQARAETRASTSCGHVRCAGELLLQRLQSRAAIFLLSGVVSACLLVPPVSNAEPPESGQEPPAATPADGVIPIFPVDSDPNTLEKLLQDAVSFVTDVVPSEATAPLGGKSEKDILLERLRNERQRLREKEDQAERDKAEAVQKKVREQEESDASREAQREKAAMDAMQKLRDEEAAKRDKLQEQVNAANDKAKEERDQRVKAERERSEAIRNQEIEIQKRRLDRVLAAAGGAGAGLGLGFMLETFRVIGGPILVANFLRTPGFFVAKKVRLVEWDLERSPMEPDGDLVQIELRSAQLSRKGLRQAIAGAYNMESSKQVKQIAKMFVSWPGRLFYERIDSREAVLAAIEDGAVIIWSQTSPSTLIMPARNDRAPEQPTTGVSQSVSQQGSKVPTRQARLHSMASAFITIAHWSRGEYQSSAALLRQKQPPLDEHTDEEAMSNGGSARPMPVLPLSGPSPAEASPFSSIDSTASDSSSDEAVGQAPGPRDRPLPSRAAETNGSSNGSAAESTNGAHDGDAPTSSQDVPAEEVAPLAWSRVRALQAPGSDPAVFRALKSLGRVPPDVEAQLVAAAINGDASLTRLFAWYAESDVVRFVAYARAHMERENRSWESSEQSNKASSSPG